MTHARPAMKADCRFIANNLRQADRNELDLWGVSPDQALIEGFEKSLQPMTVVSGAMPCAMFGVTEPVSGSGFGVVWLLGTEQLFSARVPFLRQSSLWLGHCCRPFSEVGNWVDSRNTKHIRWLRWLGFNTVDASVVNNVPLIFHHLKIK